MFAYKRAFSVTAVPEVLKVQVIASVEVFKIPLLAPARKVLFAKIPEHQVERTGVVLLFQIIESVEEDIETDDFVKENRKRNQITDLSEMDETNIQCKICNDFFKVRGFHTHLGFEHKIKPINYIDTYGEYRPSILKKIIKS